MPSCGKSLETHFSGKLDNARTGARRSDAAKRCGHGDVAVWVGEVGPVEKIEKLRAQLSAHPFLDRYEFYHRKVQVLLSWTIKKIPRRVAKWIVHVERRIVGRAEIATAE